LGAASATALLPGQSARAAKGKTVQFLLEQEPPTLVAATHTAGPTARVSPKISEGLVWFDFDARPRPALATEWTVTPDGLTYHFKLRSNVTWHDGRKFTSADVAHSVAVFKQYNPRGRSTFSSVTAIETPDELTAILRLSKPAPYLLNALDASESPIIPRHIYEGTDPLTNPNGSAPIGTGPFVFREWVRGSHILLERNPNYWDAGKPHVDRLVVRLIADQSARAPAFEVGEIDIGGGPPVPRSDLERLLALPHIAHDRRGGDYNASITQLYFNYETASLRDRRVRLAISQALDIQRLLDSVYFGFGVLSPSAVSPHLVKFYDKSIKHYPYDPKRAEALLDEAGFHRKPDGTRLALRLYANPFNTREAGDFVKQSLQKIGIVIDFQFFDFPTYIHKAYTDRTFDLALESLSNVFDPTVGIQRVFWSKNFKIGLPFSNVARYENTETDALLEAAAIEPDETKRRDLWFRIQNKLHDEVAAVHLIAPDDITVYNQRVGNPITGVTGVSGTFADIALAAA